MTITLMDLEDEYTDIVNYKMLKDTLYGLDANNSFVRLVVINNSTVGTLIRDYELIQQLLVTPFYNITFDNNRMLTKYIVNLNKIKKANVASEVDLTQDILCMHNNQVVTIDNIVVVKNRDRDIRVSIQKTLYSGVTIGGEDIYSIKFKPGSNYIETVECIGTLSGCMFVTKDGVVHESTVYTDFNITDMDNLIMTGDIG